MLVAGLFVCPPQSIRSGRAQLPFWAAPGGMEATAQAPAPAINQLTQVLVPPKCCSLGGSKGARLDDQRRNAFVQAPSNPEPMYSVATSNIGHLAAEAAPPPAQLAA